MTVAPPPPPMGGHGRATNPPPPAETLRASRPTPQDSPLLPFLHRTTLPRVRAALLTDGYCILPSVLTPHECESALALLWDFVEDTSGGVVKRDDPSSWYPASELERKGMPNGDRDDRTGKAKGEASSADDNDDDDDDDPWPHTGDSSFPDMFQSLGAGFVLGPVREILAERVFEGLFGTSKLHCSKEGFLFHRPTEVQKDDETFIWRRKVDVKKFCGTVQPRSRGEHYDQSNSTVGLHTVQCSIAFQDQTAADGHFLCYPRSHSSVHQSLTDGTRRGGFSWLPLTDDETCRLTSEFGCEPKHVFAKAGDIILWRSDLVHAAVPPGGALTPNFMAVGYVSMAPAVLTPNSPEVWTEKVNAYKWGKTGDHRTAVESWHDHKRWARKEGDQSEVVRLQRPYYRLSPPRLSFRLAQLYGLIPYGKKEEECVDRALIRGIRFLSPGSSIFPAREERKKAAMCTATTQVLTLTDGTPLLGQEKYLGGMPSACGQFVYGCPGNATRVLRVDTFTNEVDYIGPEFTGHFKWLRGLEIPPEVMGEDEYPNGCCLALPSNARSVLKVNPATISGGVSTFGELTEDDGGWSYHGGNLGIDGYVYAIPANASRVLKIDPRNDTIECIGPTFPKMKQKWFGGIIGSDQCIYGIPHNATGVLRINPKTQEVTVVGEGMLPEGQWKWHGGLATADGRKIIGFPNNAESVLIIDVPSLRVYTVSDSSVLQTGRHRIKKDRENKYFAGGRYKYLGGALTADGRFAYLFPCDAERVVRIDCETDDVKVVGPELLEGENKYQNGFVARDGCLYGIPQRASGILRITPPGVDGMGEDEEHVDVIYCGEDMVGVKDKFEGGVYGLKDDCIYCIPLRAKALLKVIPGEAISGSRISCLT